MRIEKLMRREVVSCFPDDSLREAATSMWQHDIGVLPVVERDGQIVVGVITDRDICMGALTKGLPLEQVRVSDVMSQDVISCQVDDDISALHEAMRKGQVRRVPVVDAEGHVVGIVSLNDLAIQAMTATGSSSRELGAQLAETLGAICKHREIAIA